MHEKERWLQHNTYINYNCPARKWFLVDLKRPYRLSNRLYGEPTSPATHATEGAKLLRLLCLETISLASQHEWGCILDKKPYVMIPKARDWSTSHSRINKQDKINTCFLTARSLLFCSSSFRASIKCCLSSSLYERRFSCKREQTNKNSDLFCSTTIQKNKKKTL